LASPEHRDSAPQEKPAAKSPPPAASPSPVPPTDSGADQVRKAQLKGKYVVQVASYQSKVEAEAVKGRLQDAGLPAYIVESVLKDKGTMYRVRVGKHLEPAAAAELAAKAGKNAIVILE
jgi:cell division septation protein DedD